MAARTARPGRCNTDAGHLARRLKRDVITLDEQTTLQGVPAQAWEYRLGNRSALEWVLDQYKERKITRPDHPGAFQHLPFRRPQGARH